MVEKPEERLNQVRITHQSKTLILLVINIIEIWQENVHFVKTLKIFLFLLFLRRRLLANSHKIELCWNVHFEIGKTRFLTQSFTGDFISHLRNMSKGKAIKSKCIEHSLFWAKRVSWHEMISSKCSHQLSSLLLFRFASSTECFAREATLCLCSRTS